MTVMDGDAMVFKEKPMVIDKHKHTKTQNVLGLLYTITNISSSSHAPLDIATAMGELLFTVPTAPCESKM